MYPTENWYAWREFVQVDGEDKPRFIIPWSDPTKYESPADGLFDTPGQAREWKKEFAPEEDWVLVKLTMEPVHERDNQLCLCGHPYDEHHDGPGGPSCQPGCACKGEFIPF